MSGKKFSKNEYKNPRDKKRKEIEKSLVHRANLKKKYFKLLEKEGEKVPEKRSQEEEFQEAQRAQHAQQKSKSKPPLNYGERAGLIKKRKEEKRKQILETIQQQREKMAENSKERLKKKKQLAKKTKGGQPLIAPRINSLLDKIKKEKAQEDC